MKRKKGTRNIIFDSNAVEKAETDSVSKWVANAFLGEANPPFSFTYGGQPSGELLKTWKSEHSHRKLDDQRTEHTLTYSDPKTGLVVRCVGIEYHDFPTVEWTLHFTNTGSADTPILADIQALDVQVPGNSDGEFTLYHHLGSFAAENDYEPLTTLLEPGKDVHITPVGGRGSNFQWPYFNLEWSGEGVIVVVGWPGQWATWFSRDEQTGLRVRAGQELTHFTLHPDEQVRSPLIVLQFWEGDRIRAQNIWRRWMLAHNVPRPGGKLPSPQWNATSSRWFNEMVKADEASQILFINRYLEEGLKIDYWWMDAGWYPNKTGWPNTGTWEVDKKRFPRGLRAITDYAHSKGIKCIVWFEPERVTPGTWLYENHPEWLLGPDNSNKLLNLGNPEAWQWLTNHIDKLITEEGIDLYRQDFNMDSLDCWRANDAENRQGITEIRHVTGYLSFWDELRRRYPDMLIDACASGGRRNDLETLRRAVPLHRSDYYGTVGQQCQTYGLAYWVPFYAAPIVSDDPYVVRSTMCPGFTSGWDVRRKDLDYELLRQLAAQWRAIAPYFLGDYYPLTSYCGDSDVWMAWQFHRPDLGEGVVQVFRRAESPYESARFKLRGLDPEARYVLTNFDAPGVTELTGGELMEKGLPVVVRNQPGAVVITYKSMNASE